MSSKPISQHEHKHHRLAIATIFFMVDLYFFVKPLDLKNEKVKSDKTLFRLDTNQVGKVLDGADGTGATKEDVKKPKMNLKNKNGSRRDKTVPHVLFLRRRKG
ncbi:unnamed protein product [Bursaphelenchus okinawaensis]|uniref:Uncharacterized protein n=1 Tax=Bursaphelenchus okinawaensis TaxID=465554 RepID=A0A811JWK3_9BILA|nr:unnamed protein product [Bursaphelenchus okinawaensis]CAG9086316.1 unnamed protein product [Bursaphelenchus okinawaensis]